MRKYLIVVIFIEIIYGCSNTNTVQKYYPNGNIKLEYQVLDNGKKDGKYVHYYPNGKVQTIGSFKNDSASGDWIGYFENGLIEAKSYFKNGKIEGECFHYNESGIPHDKDIYINDSVVYTEFYDAITGKLNGQKTTVTIEFLNPPKAGDTLSLKVGLYKPENFMIKLFVMNCLPISEYIQNERDNRFFLNEMGSRSLFTYKKFLPSPGQYIVGGFCHYYDSFKNEMETKFKVVFSVK